MADKLNLTGVGSKQETDSHQALEWQQLPLNPLAYLWGVTTPNQILRGDGFYISYNPGTDCGPETALCKDGGYLILLGDYREGYEPLVPEGYEACLKYFRERNAERSPWPDNQLS